MITTRTAATQIKAGERVAFDADGRAVSDPEGPWEAYGDGAPGYLVTVGTRRRPLTDTPSRVVFVDAQGRETIATKGKRI